MFTCFICSLSLKKFFDTIKHLRFIHSLYDNPNLHLKYCMLDCYNSISTISGFRKHMLKHKLTVPKLHSVYNHIENNVKVSKTNLDVQLENVSAENVNNSFNHFDFVDDNDNNTSETVDSDFVIGNIFKMFFAQLLALTLTNPQTQIIIDSVNEL